MDGKILPAHRAAYILYRGPMNEALDACHKCDVPCCVNPYHVFPGTRADNMQDCLRKGRFNPAKGSKSGRAKLNEDKVKYIKSSNKSNVLLAGELGVSESRISEVRSGKFWKHVV